jgi:hypothetical protein
MSAQPRDLVAHLARFGRALREGGVEVTLADEADALAALPLVDVGDRAEVRRALATALKVRPRDREAFEELFARWWSGRVAPGEAPPAHRARPRPAPSASHGPRRPAAPRPAPFGTAPAGDAPPGHPEGGREPGWSPEALLRRKPFDECSAAEREALERLLARLALRLATRPSRRRVPTRGPGEPDLRRSFRRAVGTGGELLALARRRRPVELPRLVVLCDTSGSMDPHVRFLLGFLLALPRVAKGSEVFAFNTSLVRLTPLLGMERGMGLRPDSGPAPVLARLAAQVPDWSGGTRIALCLSEFVARHLDELVSPKTVVIIVSDGLDRGDLAPLPDAMAAIRRRARRVLWLNPLAGDARYEPTARAMAAALPYVDRLLPAHNLESLERLLPLLAA